MHALTVKVGSARLANDLPFVLIAGPCQIESMGHAQMVAQQLAVMCEVRGIPFIFKSSFDKANRTSHKSARGVGRKEGLAILRTIRENVGCAVTTDVHTPEDAAHAWAGRYVDMIQIPALLSRQTDLLQAAGATGLPVNIKKGQFAAPDDMRHAANKVAAMGNHQVLLTERGTTFGYGDLVADMRSIGKMGEAGRPVIMDATHAAQRPGGGDASGGDRTVVPALARAAVAVGVAGVFIECHPDPDNAPSDGPCMMRLDDMPALLSMLQRLDAVVKGYVV